MRCTVTGEPYTVFGYGGQQVRDNIHSADLVRAFEAFHRAPRPAAVYNIGGGRYSNCSMLEAIELCERIAGRELEWTLGDQARMGDHRWWISDLRRVPARLPGLGARATTCDAILREIHDQNVERWSAGRREAVGRDPGPQRGGHDRSHGPRDRHDARARGHRPRGDRGRRRQHRRHRRDGRRRSRARPARCAACARPTAAASASPCGPASRRSRATPWRS